MMALAEAGILDDLVGAFNTLTCVPQHESQYNTCSRILTPFYTIQPALAREANRRDCCSLVASSNCIRTLSSYYCGAETQGPVEASLLITQTGLGCLGVNSITDCMHPVVLFGLICLVLGVIGSCLRNCCCPKAKKVVIVSSSNRDVDPLLKQEDV